MSDNQHNFTKMDLSEMLDILDFLDWSVVELADRVGVSMSTVYHWEVVPNPVAAYLRLAKKAREVV